MTRPPEIYGLLAEFGTPAEVLRAAAQVRAAGYRRWDVFTPFPVPGMDKAMGLGPSPVGWAVLACAGAGFGLALGMVWWMNAVDYPLIVGGKPMFSVLAALPVAFEAAILLGALGAVAGLLWHTDLPRLHHPLLKQRTFRLATRDRFFLVLESADPLFVEAEARRLLETAGSRRIERIEP